MRGHTRDGVDIRDNLKDALNPGDDLYILGDLSGDTGRGFEQAIQRLKGLRVPRTRLHLILGNHDSRRPSRLTRLVELSADVGTLGQVCLPDGTVCLLSHFQWDAGWDMEPVVPLSTNWNAPRYRPLAPHRVDGLYLLHGHTHAPVPFEFADPSQLNVGVDAWGMRPVSAERVMAELEGDADSPTTPRQGVT